MDKQPSSYKFHILIVILLLVLHGSAVLGQVCSWNTLKKSIFHGVVGKPAHFHFKSLTRSFDGILFTCKLAGTQLAVFEYKSGPAARFVGFETPSPRVIASSKYVSKTESEHNLTIKSLLASDDGKQLTFQREGCSVLTERTGPVTLSVSCCDPYVLGSHAAMATAGTIKCNDKVLFVCNETMYQPMHFTAMCHANSTWNILQHACEPKSQQRIGSVFGIGSIVLLLLLCAVIVIIKWKIKLRSTKLNKMIDTAETDATPLLTSRPVVGFIDPTKNEKDENETKKDSQSLRYKLLEGRATDYCKAGRFADAIECLKQLHMIQKTKVSLLLMAECYAQLDSRKDEIKWALGELKNLLSDVRDVIDSADDLIEDGFYLRALFLLRIASDMFKCDTALASNDIADGIFVCFGKTVPIFNTFASFDNKSNTIAIRYAMQYMKEMADGLRAVADADPHKQAEYYACCVGEIGLRSESDDKSIEYYKKGVKYLEAQFGESVSECVLYGRLLESIGDTYHKIERKSEYYSKALRAYKKVEALDGDQNLSKILDEINKKINDLDTKNK